MKDAKVSFYSPPSPPPAFLIAKACSSVPYRAVKALDYQNKSLEVCEPW